MSVAADYSTLTLTAQGRGTATITVTAQDSDANLASDAFDLSVEPEPESPAGAPTVAAPLADVRLVGPEQRAISLAGAFNDPDGNEVSDEFEMTVAPAS